MFGLTKREQRWKAEQRAAELLVSLASTTVQAISEARVAEAQANHSLCEVGWICEDGFPALVSFPVLVRLLVPVGLPVVARLAAPFE